MPVSANQRPRRFSPQAGRALEILGHAIEYLADEHLVEPVDVSNSIVNGRMEAIQLLTAINRQIYFECPEVPKFSDRIRTILRPAHPRAANRRPEDWRNGS